MSKTYNYLYKTPSCFDDIILSSDGTFLTGLIFNQDNIQIHNDDLPIFKETSKQLDEYFNGKRKTFNIPIKVSFTPFKKEVLDITANIPYGKTLCYGDIANIIAKKRGIKKMSSRAVGGALHSNPICIIIPCHRVIGKNGKLTGYGGGINNKEALLKLECEL